MKLFVLFSLCAIASSKYSLDNNLRYSDANLEELRSHVYCYIDKGPCDDVAQAYKKHIQEAVQEACAKCTDGQMKAAYTFQIAARQYFPEEYKQYRHKYDPVGKYFDAFFAAIQPKS